MEQSRCARIRRPILHRSPHMRLGPLLVVGCLGICAPSALSAADAPFFGKWKEDTTKTQMQEVTLTIHAVGEALEIANDYGETYSVKLDGKDYPARGGNTEAWRLVQPGRWQV